MCSTRGCTAARASEMFSIPDIHRTAVRLMTMPSEWSFDIFDMLDLRSWRRDCHASLLRSRLLETCSGAPSFMPWMKKHIPRACEMESSCKSSLELIVRSSPTLPETIPTCCRNDSRVKSGFYRARASSPGPGDAPKASSSPLAWSSCTTRPFMQNRCQQKYVEAGELLRSRP